MYKRERVKEGGWERGWERGWMGCADAKRRMRKATNTTMNGM